MSADKDKQKDIMDRFQRLAMRQTLVTYGAMFFFAFAFIATMFPDTSITGLSPEWEFRAALVLGFGLAVASWFHWRCPECNKFLGFKIGLRACPKCKAQFKKEVKR